MGRRGRRRHYEDQELFGDSGFAICGRCKNKMYSPESISAGVCFGCKGAETLGTVKVSATVPCYSCQDQIPAGGTTINDRPVCDSCISYFYGDEWTASARPPATQAAPVSTSVRAQEPARDIEVFRND